MSDKKNIDNSEIIASVNNEKIARSELDSYMNQIATIRKVPLSKEDKNIELEALNQIINSILLFQDAENQGITMTKEEVDTQYLAIVSQVGGEEKLNEALEKTGITLDHLRKDLERQNVIERYFNFIKEKNEITVTEEEARNFYENEIVPQNPDLKFEEIEPQIRLQIEHEKINQPISEIIKNLREEADIKILI